MVNIVPGWNAPSHLDESTKQLAIAASERVRGVRHETTTEAQRLANGSPTFLQRLITAREARREQMVNLGWLPCFQNLSCKFQPWCCTEKTSWIPPDINPNGFAFKATSVTIHIFSARVEGKVLTALKNNSAPGQKVVHRRCRCTGGQETATTSDVDGSADIASTGDHTHTWHDLRDTTMEKLQDYYERIMPGDMGISEVPFHKDGLWAVIGAIWDDLKNWWTGRPQPMLVTLDIDHVVTHNWLGSTLTKMFHFNLNRVGILVDNFDIEVFS